MDYKFINMEYLDSVSGGDPEIINEIVVIFKEQSVEIYNEMKISSVSKELYITWDYWLIKQNHQLQLWEWMILAEMLKTFELQAREGKEPQLYESYIERFKSETEEAIRELDDLISNRLNRNE